MAAADSQTFPLRELPEGCLALALSRLTPADAARLAGVSSAWRAAASSDLVWAQFVPRHIKELCRGALLDVCVTGSLARIYRQLCEGVLLDDGTHFLEVDPFSGALRLLFLVKHSLQPHSTLLRRETDSSSLLAQARIAQDFSMTYHKTSLSVSAAVPPGLYSVAWRLAKGPPKLSTAFPNELFPEPLGAKWSSWVAASRVRLISSCSCVVNASKSIIDEECLAELPSWSEVHVMRIRVGGVNGSSMAQGLHPVRLEADLVEVTDVCHRGGLFINGLVLCELKGSDLGSWSPDGEGSL